MVLKLGAAVLVGGLVGFERERRDRPAGLRTHILVCLGSTLITLVSIEMAVGRADPTRIAAQIVSGIGFLGAGTIFRSETGIRGLTTAAGLWVVAGIGMGIGAGGAMLWVSVTAAALVFIVNRWVRLLEDRFARGYREATVTVLRGSDGLARVLEGLEQRGADVERVRWLDGKSDEDRAVVALHVRLPRTESPNSLASWIGAQPGVRQVEWD